MSSYSVEVYLAFLMLVFTVAGLVAAFFWALPFSVGRYKRFPDYGDPRRVFAFWQMVYVLIATGCLLAFLVVATIVIVITDPLNLPRMYIARTGILSGIMLVSLQLILIPVGQRRVEEAASNESEPIVHKLDLAAREAEDRFSEAELEKSEVRNRLDTAATRTREYHDLSARDISERLDHIIDLLGKKRDV